MPLRSRNSRIKGRNLMTSSALIAALGIAAIPSTADAASWTQYIPGYTTTTSGTTASTANQAMGSATNVATAAATTYGGATAGAATAAAMATASTAVATAVGGCAAQATVKAFAKFGDTADYYLAPGGGFESGTAGWTLTGGASLVSGNESLGVSAGSKALKLPPNATATSPAFCVDKTNPHFRFATRADSAKSGYTASVIYTDASGKGKEAQFTSSSDMKDWEPGKWTAANPSPLATKIPLSAMNGTASVRLKFKSTDVAAGFGMFAMGAIGVVSIDSVMVDPYRRG